MRQADKIISVARGLIGTQYRHMGRDRTGIDCLGVAIYVAKALGMDVPPTGDYSRNPSGRRMMLAFREHAIPIRVSEAEPGDFLHMAFQQLPQHVAIITESDPMTIVHADSVVGRVVEHPLSATWRARIRGAYRFPEIW